MVVDANVVISALVAKGVTHKVFLLNSLLERFDFIAPELLWSEVNKHKPMLLSETHLTAEELDDALGFLGAEIDVLPAKEFVRFLPEAERISPDQKDKQYFALALAFGCGIFSGDKLLKQQSAVRVYSPRELLDMMTGAAKG